MKRTNKRLAVGRETIRNLSGLQLRSARGGRNNDTTGDSTGVPCLSYEVCLSDPKWTCDSTLIICLPTTTE